MLRKHLNFVGYLTIIFIGLLIASFYVDQLGFLKKIVAQPSTAAQFSTKSVAIRSGFVTINGKKIFPVGIWPGPMPDSHYTDPDVRWNIPGVVGNQSYNLISDSAYYNDKDTLDKKISVAGKKLDSAAASLKYLKLGIREDEYLADKNGNILKKFTSSLKNKNGLFAYYLDEPTLASSGNGKEALSVADCEAIYKILKKEDPRHPVIMTHYAYYDKQTKQTASKDLYNAYDIFEMDDYPYNTWLVDKYYPREQTLYYYDSTVKQHLTNIGSKPLLAVIQSFGGYSTYLTPTADETRAMAYIAIINGAKGISFYVYDDYSADDINNDSNRREIIQKTARDIINMSHVLLSGALQKNVSADNTTDIVYRLYKYSSSYYLFAVNLSYKQQKVSFTLKDVNPNYSIATFGLGGTGSAAQGRQLKMTNNNVLTDTFDGRAAHVYQISPSIIKSIPNNK